MPPTYEPSSSRNLKNTEERIQKAIDDILKKRFQGKASAKRGNPAVALKNKMKNKRSKKPVGQKNTPVRPEKSFVDSLMKLSKRGILLNRDEFSHLLDHYLDLTGVSDFADDSPNSIFVDGFFRDNPELAGENPDVSPDEIVEIMDRYLEKFNATPKTPQRLCANCEVEVEQAPKTAGQKKE